MSSILNPVVELRGNVAQDVPADRIQVAIFGKETNDALFLLEWLNGPIQQDAVEAAVMESDVILVMLVESVHGISFQF